MLRSTATLSRTDVQTRATMQQRTTGTRRRRQRRLQGQSAPVAAPRIARQSPEGIRLFTERYAKALSEIWTLNVETRCGEERSDQV